MRVIINGVNCQFSGQGRRYSSTYLKFDRYVQSRRTQAEKSVIVQIKSPSLGPELKSYLTSNFGKLEFIHQYSLPGKGKSVPSSSIAPHSGEFHWVLAEFTEKNDFIKAFEKCQYADLSVPFQTSMSWYKSSSSNHGSKKGESRRNDSFPFEKLGKPSPTPDFTKTKSMNEQLKILENSVKLTVLGIRLRFVIARQLEHCLERLFPMGCVLPFGSSVSGIGRQSGDLDLVLLPDKREIFPYSKTTTDSSLYYQTKLFSNGNTANARFQIQRVMETMADIINIFVPGCTHVQRILQARVPILRFWSDYTDLQCDLSMTNSSGVHMSELIYIMSSLEGRFSTLLCAIRSWASARKITNPVPGRQPTNFMFVLLLIYFLQHKKILPTLDILFNNAGKDDTRTTSDGIDCTFLRDQDKILKLFTPQKKNESLSELLFEFFEFYSEFDFQNKGVSVLTGNSWSKPDAGPMYIQNPLERHLNVSRNVSREEINRFKSKTKEFLLVSQSFNSKEPRIGKLKL